MSFTKTMSLFGILAALLPYGANAFETPPGYYKINVVSPKLKAYIDGYEIVTQDKGMSRLADVDWKDKGKDISREVWTLGWNEVILNREDGKNVTCRLTGATPYIVGGKSYPVFNFGTGPNYLWPCKFPAKDGHPEFGMECHGECDGKDCNAATCNGDWSGGEKMTVSVDV